MNIYVIEVNCQITWDSYDSHVIVANTSDEVVNLAKAKACDEGKDAWSKENVKFIGFYTGNNTEPFIVVSSFNAG